MTAAEFSFMAQATVLQKTWCSNTFYMHSESFQHNCIDDIIFTFAIGKAQQPVQETDARSSQ